MIRLKGYANKVLVRLILKNIKNYVGNYFTPSPRDTLIQIIIKAVRAIFEYFRYASEP